MWCPTVLWHQTMMMLYWTFELILYCTFELLELFITRRLQLFLSEKKTAMKIRIQSRMWYQVMTITFSSGLILSKLRSKPISSSCVSSRCPWDTPPQYTCACGAWKWLDSLSGSKRRAPSSKSIAMTGITRWIHKNWVNLNSRSDRLVNRVELLGSF